MALKGLDIFKLSPKKNCKECGSPTCMAFCMKVAQGAVSLDKCPYFSEEALATLNSATAPLMKTITRWRLQAGRRDCPVSSREDSGQQEPVRCFRLHLHGRGYC